MTEQEAPTTRIAKISFPLTQQQSDTLVQAASIIDDIFREMIAQDTDIVHCVSEDYSRDDVFRTILTVVNLSMAQGLGNPPTDDEIGLEDDFD